VRGMEDIRGVGRLSLKIRNKYSINFTVLILFYFILFFYFTVIIDNKFFHVDKMSIGTPFWDY
jgi:hypothetical protein